MKKSAKYVLGSCLMLQALPVPFSGFFSTGTPLISAEQLSSHQSRSLALDLALYMTEATHTFVPMQWREKSAVIVDAVVEASNRFEIDPLLLMAVIKHESRFNPDARGSHGEIGLMQIKPSTALWLLEEKLVPAVADEPTLDSMRELLRDPKTNILFGAAYLAHLRGTFQNRSSLYLAAYNMGAVNLKHRLRDGLHPHVYSDHIDAELQALGQGFTKARHASRVGRLTRTLASDSISSRTLGLN